MAAMRHSVNPRENVVQYGIMDRDSRGGEMLQFIHSWDLYVGAVLYYH